MPKGRAKKRLLYSPSIVFSTLRRPFFIDNARSFAYRPSIRLGDGTGRRQEEDVRAFPAPLPFRNAEADVERCPRAQEPQVSFDHDICRLDMTAD